MLLTLVSRIFYNVISHEGQSGHFGKRLFSESYHKRGDLGFLISDYMFSFSPIRIIRYSNDLNCHSYFP